MPTIPQDFNPHFKKSPVTDPWEPLFSRRRAGGVDLMFEVASSHCNSRGFLHGGVLAALADNVMGLSLAVVLDKAKPSIVTINLALDYFGSAQVGDAIVIEPHVGRAGGRLGFCDALVKCGQQTIARANATFSVRLPDPSSDAAG